MALGFSGGYVIDSSDDWDDEVDDFSEVSVMGY
jgi:hypothetical protein